MNKKRRHKNGSKTRKANPADVKNYDTDRLRHDFLIQNLFVADEIKTIYSQIDRIIVGAATPVNKELVLEAGAELRAKYFLERREMGIINIGGNRNSYSRWQGI